MKRLFYLLLPALAMVGCMDDDTNTPNSDRLIPINISTSIMRATDTTFEMDDKVGIYVVNQPNVLVSSGNHVDNVGFTYSGNWTPDKEVYWKDHTTKADFYAYYPYGNPVDVSAHTFEVSADQSEEENYWASDFLWGRTSSVTPSEVAVPINMKHILSNMLIYVKAGEGFTEESLANSTIDVKINGVQTVANIDLATGVATAVGETTTITPWNTGEYYRALVVPQTVASDTDLITVTVDGYDYVLTQGHTFVANKKYIFTVTLSNENSGVTISLSDWEVEEGNFGGTLTRKPANNEIWYTSIDGQIVTPTMSDAFDANIVSNTYVNGQGVIRFDKEVTSIGVAAFQNTTISSITFPDSLTDFKTWCLGGCHELSAVYGQYATDDHRFLIIDDVLIATAPKGLINCTIPEGVKVIDNNAVRWCTELETVVIPEGVESINYCAFYMCDALKSVVIPNSVTTIDRYAFGDCGLESIVVPESVDVIGAGAFSICKNLSEVTIHNYISEFGPAIFDGCHKLTSFYGVYASSDNRCLIIDGILYKFAVGCGAKSYTIPDGVVQIGDGTGFGGNTFEGCTTLESIIIPEGITEIGFQAFAGCSNLTEITIPSSVISFGNDIFDGCDKLASFYGAHSSPDHRSLIIYGQLIEYARGCKEEHYTIPEGVFSIDYNAFRGTESLKSVVICDDVTSIGGSAFGYCTNLESITIPNSVTTIMESAFYGCDKLTNITIPNGIAEILYGTFYGCSSLTSFTIPESVMVIQKGSFLNCTQLSAVYCRATTPPDITCPEWIVDPSFIEFPFDNNAAGRKIYVPTESVDAYKVAEGWKEYADAIEGYDFTE